MVHDVMWKMKMWRWLICEICVITEISADQK